MSSADRVAACSNSSRNIFADRQFAGSRDVQDLVELHESVGANLLELESFGAQRKQLT